VKEKNNNVDLETVRSQWHRQRCHLLPSRSDKLMEGTSQHLVVDVHVSLFRTEVHEIFFGQDRRNTRSWQTDSTNRSF